MLMSLSKGDLPALRSPSASAAMRTSGSSRLTLLALPSPQRSGLAAPTVPLPGVMSRSMPAGESAPWAWLGV